MTRIWMAVFVVGSMLVGCQEDGGAASPSATGVLGATAPKFRVAVHLWNEASLTQYRPVLEAGDFVFVGSVSLGTAAAAAIPGIHVIYASHETDSVTTMAAHLASNPLPPEIEYVRYDFEPGYQPEFTWVESEALPYFAQARDICASFGKKVFPTPFNPFRGETEPTPWDMGEIALRSHDALNVQLQRTLDKGIANYQQKALHVRDDVRARRQDSLLFLQVSCNLSDWLAQSDEQTVRDLVEVGTWLRQQAGISGMLVFAKGEDIDMAVEIIKAVRAAPAADTAAPTCALTAPAAGASLSGTATLTATASDDTGVTHVAFFANGAWIGTDATAPYSIAWDTTSVPSGRYALTAKAHDAAGNVGLSASVTVAVNVDTTGPALAWLSPTHGATVTGTVTLSAAASDPAGVSHVSFFVNGKWIDRDDVAPYGCSWKSGAFKGKTVKLTAKAHDLKGNVTIQSIDVKVN